ncbi:MAG: hypothetical protein K5917_07040 [Clostridiales bacterium]|nr:hypothetical protein [Clostridiales bacterium]
MEFKTYWNTNINNDLKKIMEFIDNDGEYKYKYKYGISIIIGETLDKTDIKIYNNDDINLFFNIKKREL